MFSKSRFSIAKAWITSLTISVDNIVFYIGWNFVVLTIGMFLLVFLGIVMGIFDTQVLIQDYSWIKHFFLNLFRSFSLESLKSIKEVGGHEPYDILKLFFPENILNKVLEHKSWSEFFNVILLPNKAVISLIVMLISIFSMTTTIGYIKTALKFQDGQKASFRDMYQYFYLVPRFFLVKFIMTILLLFVVGFSCEILFSVFALFSKNGSSNSFFFLMFPSILMVMLVSVIYQRLRFMQYLVIDKNISILDSIKTSWSITKGNVMHLFVYTSLGIFVQITFLRSLSSFFRILYGNADKQAEVSIYKELNQ